MGSLSPAVILYDVDGNEVKIPVEGNLRMVGVRDEEQLGALQKVLRELKIMNMHLATLTGNEIKYSDVEEP